ncbi:MAG TPA: QueT transporter family protein [Defluviitaleaceae bacterium]|nr:QueT transporter family protein [Defluviitaleaceae bacterium]HPT75923.1 QueT transporter family protein [Defluviitaleaceae bacterium]HQD49503.1 QueT transporter family protein [Defluviitaleaceae bacterium]
MNKYTKFLTQAAAIAAIYVVITLTFGFMGFGPVQFRISEALTVLPYFTPAAIPGLFIGCLISNLVGSSLLDIIFGSLATLIAAILSYKMPKKFLVPLPPVLVNAIVVPIILKITMNAPFLMSIVTVGLGQVLACYGIGYPLILLLDKNKQKIF